MHTALIPVGLVIGRQVVLMKYFAILVVISTEVLHSHRSLGQTHGCCKSINMNKVLINYWIFISPFELDLLQIRSL